MDEAMHPLTMLASGLYGERASAAGWRADSAGGAVEVWVQGDQVDREDQAGREAAADDLEQSRAARIRLLCQRQSARSIIPRWSQATEQRIGEFGRRKTLMFNGYADRSPASTPAWTCGNSCSPCREVVRLSR